jgi:hypothetical protein
MHIHDNLALQIDLKDYNHQQLKANQINISISKTTYKLNLFPIFFTVKKKVQLLSFSSSIDF